MNKSVLSIFLLALLCTSALSFRHVLSSFDNEFQKMKHYRNIGDSSAAFSIAMKMLVAV